MKTWFYIWLTFAIVVSIASVLAGKYHALIMALVCLVMALVCKGAYRWDKQLKRQVVAKYTPFIQNVPLTTETETYTKAEALRMMRSAKTVLRGPCARWESGDFLLYIDKAGNKHQLDLK